MSRTFRLTPGTQCPRLASGPNADLRCRLVCGRGHRPWTHPAPGSHPPSCVLVYDTPMVKAAPAIGESLSSHGRPCADLTATIAAVVGETEGHALMLYGSVARGDQDADSDIDVLQLVDYLPGHSRIEGIDVSRYTVNQLLEMARRGSLFVLHLREEGRIIEDRSGVLRGILDEFEFPSDGYQGLVDALGAAAKMTDTTRAVWEEHATPLTNAALYLLRTLAYVRSVRLGCLVFSTETVAEALDDPGLAQILKAKRRADEYTWEFFVEVRAKLSAYLGISVRNEFESLEALAVALSKPFPAVTYIIARVLSGERYIDYARLPMLDVVALDG